MKTKKISKIYLIVFAILLALLCSFSIALTAFNNADAKETVALNLENDISETNDGYQNTKFILHGHTIYSYWEGKNITENDIVDYTTFYNVPTAFTDFNIKNNNLNCDHCLLGMGRFGIDLCSFDSSGGEYIVGMRVNGVDIQNLQFPYGIELRETSNPDDLNYVELVFSTTPPPALDTEIFCTFNSNGGVFPANYSETLNKNEKYLNRFELPETPTKEGLTFKGWFDAENSPVTADNSFFKTENNAFAAKWLATLSYDLNGGEGPEIIPADYDEGTTATLHTGEGIIKTDDTLLGWNTSADGTGQHYDLGSTFEMTKHTKLYAEWQSNVPKPEPEPTPEPTPGENVNAVPQTGDSVNAIIPFAVLATACVLAFFSRRKTNQN